MGENFRRLDKDGDGWITSLELMPWESGLFHTELALEQLFKLADADEDAHLTIAELDDAKHKIVGSDSQYHFLEWVDHLEL
eukprot:NODE_9074_length_355_cov_164.940000.p2 GENE.NODE_9074_length_355_cov_164.940000~~NODE_9074_length_355_cov_164.940000.p2  ORF type:complete len:81 (+),score=29.63 NODE_9074_length_355_cov_164.940000:3-245(+)